METTQRERDRDHYYTIKTTLVSALFSKIL